SRQDNFGAAQLLKFCRRVLRFTVDVNRSPELASEQFLVFSACNANGVESHLRSVLHSEMAKSAQAVHRYHVPRPSAAVAQCIEWGQTGANRGSGIKGRQIAGHPRDCADRCDHVFGVTAVETDSRDLTGHARKEITTAAMDAAAAIAAVPADSHALTGLPAN